MQPLSIKLFLASGSATGLRTAEISNWSGKALACSRGELADLALRDESSRPGVYVLTGTDPDSGDPAAYVGETEEVGKRLKQHLKRDFWNQALVFVSKDENLTKAHIKYLEDKLIIRGLEAGRGVLQNAQSSGARLPEADQAEMDAFLENIMKLLPVLGTHLFVATADEATREKPRLVCTIKDLKAFGQRTEGGFVVYAGSQAVAAHRESAGPFIARRAKLIEAGVLVPLGDSLVFARDYEFSSPSLAAGVVCGGHMNGLVSWKNEAGQTLKQLEERE